MFDYTKASMAIVLDDIKKYAKMFKRFSLGFTTGYFVYVIVMQVGILAVNIILAMLFLTYTIFEFLTFKDASKEVKRLIRKSYKILNLTIRLITLGALIYGIYTATREISALSILFATLMIVLWVLQVFLEIFVHILENKVDLVVAGWNKDMEDLKKPITDIGRVVKKIKGEKLPPPPEKSKEIIRLEKKIEELEKEKKAKKDSAKPLKVVKTKFKTQKTNIKQLK